MCTWMVLVAVKVKFCIFVNSDVLVAPGFDSQLCTDPYRSCALTYTLLVGDNRLSQEEFIRYISHKQRERDSTKE